MHFLRILDTNVDDAYDVISTFLNSTVRNSEVNGCELEIELPDQIHKENLFLHIIGEYENAGYDVNFIDGMKSNRYLIKLCWENYVRPEDEYMQFIDYINGHNFEYKTFKVSNLRRMPSQLSTFPAYRSSGNVIEYMFDYVKTCVNSFLKFA
jgi:hypothetical protein